MSAFTRATIQPIIERNISTYWKYLRFQSQSTFAVSEFLNRLWCFSIYDPPLELINATDLPHVTHIYDNMRKDCYDEFLLKNVTKITEFLFPLKKQFLYFFFYTTNLHL